MGLRATGGERARGSFPGPHRAYWCFALKLTCVDIVLSASIRTKWCIVDGRLMQLDDSSCRCAEPRRASVAPVSPGPVVPAIGVRGASLGYVLWPGWSTERVKAPLPHLLFFPSCSVLSGLRCTGRGNSEAGNDEATGTKGGDFRCTRRCREPRGSRMLLHLLSILGLGTCRNVATVTDPHLDTLVGIGLVVASMHSGVWPLWTSAVPVVEVARGYPLSLSRWNFRVLVVAISSAWIRPVGNGSVAIV